MRQDENPSALFAPWRMDWVTDENRNAEIDGCVFCQLPSLNPAREHRVVAKSEGAYVLLNKSPYNPGHVLIIPMAHVSALDELTLERLYELIYLVRVTTQALRTGLHPDGFNVGLNLGSAGGASIESHLHIHVVPRWESDTTFLPTTANTKLIPEALDDTFDRLRESFAALEETEIEDTDSAVDVSPDIPSVM